MSSTASNYDVPRLALGASLAVGSVILTLFTLPALRPVSPQGLSYTLILALYSILMFASSYVEEEHNFWYWATSAWLFYLFVSASRKEWTSNFLLHPAITVLVIHRIIRRWNQTGQKYAGADDIVHSPLFYGSNSILLWALIGSTYLDVTNRLSRHVARSIAAFEGLSGVSFSGPQEDLDPNRFMAFIAVLPLGVTAFLFKLGFTTLDAPELTGGISPDLLNWVAGLGLVGVARMVFGGIVLSAFWIAAAEWKRSQGRRKNIDGNGGKFRFFLVCRRFGMAMNGMLTLERLCTQTWQSPSSTSLLCSSSPRQKLRTSPYSYSSASNSSSYVSFIICCTYTCTSSSPPPHYTCKIHRHTVH